MGPSRRPGSARGTGCRTRRRRRARRSARRGSRAPSARVRTCTPPAAANGAWWPSRAAESWLPLVITTAAPAARIASTASSNSSNAAAAGVAESNTSPATSTTSTCSRRTASASSSSTPRSASSVECPWKVRPMCQSEVWSRRMPRTLTARSDTASAVRPGGIRRAGDRDPQVHRRDALRHAVERGGPLGRRRPRGVEARERRLVARRGDGPDELVGLRDDERGLEPKPNACLRGEEAGRATSRGRRAARPRRSGTGAAAPCVPRLMGTLQRLDPALLA